MSNTRVALVCDPLEEQWPSMDLVADMLFQFLRTNHPDLYVEQIRPAMRQPLSRLGPSFSTKKIRNAERLLHRFVEYPAILRKQVHKFDVFHVIDHSYSQLIHELPAERTIVSCHDLDAFRSVLDKNKERRSKLFQAMTKRILDGMTKAARVVFDSRTVQEELAVHGLVPSNRTSVVLHAAHPECSPLPDPEADPVASRLLNLSEDAPCLLHVGSTIPRKRIDILLQVFEGVKKLHPKAKLVRVGGLFTAAQQALAEHLKIDKDIKIMPHVERRVLSAIYRRADLVLVTSDAEGFGLPVVEAMACACPVVASDLGVLRETGGAAAVFCPTADTEQWIETVSALLIEKSRNPRSWATRQEACLRNADRFSWKTSTAQFAEIYRTLAGLHAHSTGWAGINRAITV